MSILVQKFGGSSVKDARHLRNAARRMAEACRSGHRVIGVLSAQGDTTDHLLAKAAELHPAGSRRELDMLLATGEQASVALCALALEAMGLPAVSLGAWQVPIITDGVHGDARIREVAGERIRTELTAGKIVLVAGFQGLSPAGDLTTLGRGGSDTTAVALAAAFDAALCQIHTDVDGVYTADPRLAPQARKLPTISYGAMLELASEGARVLHDRSVELAQKYRVPLEVLSSTEKSAGTRITEAAEGIGGIAGITRTTQAALLTLPAVRPGGGEEAGLLFLLQEAGLRPQIAHQTQTEALSLMLPREQTEAAAELMGRRPEGKGLQIRAELGKLSVVQENPTGTEALTRRLEAALTAGGLGVWATGGSPRRSSLLVEREQTDSALVLLHQALFP